tara:strand:+ start:1102 stop:2121 length:1020 start_codon:yes stop_codon:yes gene_type:complete
MSNKRKIAFIAVGIGCSVLFMYLTFKKIPLDDFYRELQRVDLWLLSLSLITGMLGFLCMAYRSVVLLRSLADYRYYPVLKSVFVGFIGNALIPFRVGELMRVDYLARRCDVSLPHSSTLAVIVTERVFDLLVLMLMCFAVLPLTVIGLPTSQSFYILLAATVSIFAGALLCSLYPERVLQIVRWVVGGFGDKLSAFIMDKVEAFVHGVSALSSVRSLVMVFLSSCMYWLTGIASIHICLWAFGLSLPWYASVLVLLFLSLGTALPSTSAYIGTYHYFFATALTLLHVNKATAASVSVVGHAVGLIPFVLLGTVLLFDDFASGRLLTLQPEAQEKQQDEE